MPLYLTKDKINEIDTEVLVCPYGLDEKNFKDVQEEIYQLAGKDRLTRAVKQKKADTSVFMTPSYDLNKDYICHVLFGKKSILHYYRLCLDMAINYQCKKIAFPVYDVSEIDKIVAFFGEFLLKKDLTIYLYTDKTISTSDFNKELDSYINENYLIGLQEKKNSIHPEKNVISGIDMLRLYSTQEVVATSTSDGCEEDTFYQRLFRYIDAKEMSNQMVYRKANLTKEDFDRIVEDPSFKPRMHTTLAFAMALNLTMQQTEDLLKRAGYSFNKKSKLYFLFEYFIQHDFYNVHIINLYLFIYNFKTLGI